MQSTFEKGKTGMEYGLRRYEAVQRLLWFLFFLACLAMAYLFAQGYQSLPADLSGLPTFQPESLKSAAFWMQLSWVAVEPLGKIMIFLVWVGLLFLAGRFVWLLVQYAGRYFVKNILSGTITTHGMHPRALTGNPATHSERVFPAEELLRKVSPLPLQIVFHPFQRLRLMLTNRQGVLASEELVEKERRIVEADWQILWGSWTPFRWLLWMLPLLALMQTSWLFYLQLQPAVSGQKDLQDLLGPVFTSLLPLVQIIGVTVFLSIGGGLLRRVENLYLSNVDALFYDQFLSRVPFQSSDTLILLDVLQRNFDELRGAVKRLELAVGGQKNATAKRD